MPRPKDQIFLWINYKWCKRCGICAKTCPKNVIEMQPSGYPKLARMEDCIDCGMCSTMCPDYAIFNEQSDVINLGFREDAGLGDSEKTQKETK